MEHHRRLQKKRTKKAVSSEPATRSYKTDLFEDRFFCPSTGKKLRKWTVEYGPWADGYHWYIDGWKELSGLNLINEEDLCVCEFVSPRSTKGCHKQAVLRGKRCSKSSKHSAEADFPPPANVATTVGPVRGFVNQIKNLLQLSNQQQQHFRVVLAKEVFGYAEPWVTYVDPVELTEFANRIRNPKEMDWLYGWQLDLWAGYLYDKIRENNHGRIQFISSFGTYEASDDHSVNTRIHELFTVMENHRAEVYAVPCYRTNHFFLLLICPNQDRIFCLDSKLGGITPEKEDCQKILNGLAKKYHKEVRSDNIEPPSDYSWEIINIMHKMQPQDWECGYYVMLWMEKIAIGFDGVDVPTCFPEDPYSYRIDEIMAVTGRWCQAWLEKSAAICEDQL